MLHDVPEEQRTCACGRAKAKIGEDVTEQLDYIPGKIEVLRHIYPKYACSCCKDGVTTAPTALWPDRRWPGRTRTLGLSSWSASSSSTCRCIASRTSWPGLTSWSRGARSAAGSSSAPGSFKPLVELMHKEVLKSEVIQGDETPVPVLDRSRDPTRKGYIWTTIGDRAHPYTTFHYTDSRSRDGPAEFLKGYAGYLQTDAYASYESVVKESAGKIIAVGCWAHVRRDFFDARHNQPREVHYVLGLIAQLYDVEDEVRGRSDQERLAARQERSVPVLKRLEAYLREQKGLALPKSQFGKAINYALNQWEALLLYASDGRLEIDNNSSERTLRPCAIGRNYAEFLIMRSSKWRTSGNPRIAGELRRFSGRII